MECHYCKRPCNKVAFIPETGMTIDFPVCNDICLTKLRLERGYSKPEKDWEIDFMIEKLELEKSNYLDKIDKKIEELRNKLLEAGA